MQDKNKVRTRLIKDTEHSNYTKQIELNKTEVRKIIANIKIIKDLIKTAVMLENKESHAYYSSKLKGLRNEFNALSSKIKELRNTRSSHQREMACKTQTDVIVDVKKLKPDTQKPILQTKKDVSWTMYSIVLKQLNPIEKGIQSAHSIIEYSLKYHDLDSFIKWHEDNKITLLEANNVIELCNTATELESLNVCCTTYNEPDLYGIPTSISFMASEKVWDADTYLDYDAFRMININETYPYSEKDMKEKWAESVFNTTIDEADKIIMLRKLIASKTLTQ